MKRISARLRHLALAIALPLGLAASVQAAEPIRIGSVLSVTGAASYIGDPEAKTLKLYADRINAAGGVLGRPIELVTYDDAGDANKARTFAQRLVERDNVVAMVGGSTTGTTMAMIPVFEAAKLPFMSLAGSVNIIEPVRQHVFKSPHTDRMGCERVFSDMKKRNFTSIALIAGTDGFGTSMREQCLKVVDKYGIKILIDQTYGAQDTDMTPQLAKIKATPGVQAILNTGASGQGPAVLTRNYGQLDMKSIPLYQNPGVASKSYIELSGAAAEGVRLPAAALLVASKLPASDPQKPVVTGYMAAYEKATGQPVSTFGGGAYDGLMMVVEAIKRANSADPRKIRDALEQTRGFVGTSGVVNMTPQDHLGLTVEAFRMLEVKNGDWLLID
ncbi:amino acid/amide ABC transporter substrate-binding protein, HAAT family [Variovorax sp. PDC80]|uniref:ABC transporter substrate-binding protein n=1 Tax=Variovorax sp. PDC80 TaxID=1882827 RepID=UPI0008DF0C06|nr:ABC transporter substrate-binding protein [Variovorax sp. PDC80]SFO77755.1 amino acid/amide ABC transporter substrate-binding protein, HAAT family [Variovorax sp. PDC80]